MYSFFIVYKMATGQFSNASSNRGKVQVVRSSLPYQILLYLNAWYFLFFFVVQILIYIFKSETLPYASGVLAGEMILLVFLAIAESMRLFFGRKGNLTERMDGVIISLVLSIPSLFGVLFILLWQTYVLLLDVILASIQISFIGLELIFAVISIITFARAAPY